MKKWIRRGVLALAAAALGVLLYVQMQPAPLGVDTVRVTRGPLRVTIDQEGKARAHDHFAVTAPVGGRVERILLHEGDRVAAGQVVATLHPAPVDPREREQLEARLRAAQSLEREARAAIDRVRAGYEQRKRDRERNEKLAKDGDIPLQALETSRSAEQAAEAELAAARFRAEAAGNEVAVARAALLAGGNAEPGQTVPVRSPVRGRVLQLPDASERVVAAGAPLLILGDATQLEVAVDVLSSDAVKVRTGMTVWLEGWGGERPLRARVRLVEPRAFTKVSALGIEEQRVNVIADFVDPPGPLGDGYRVDARIVVWEGDKVLQAPASALFRCGSEWCVFAVERGEKQSFARTRKLVLGQRGGFQVEVREGVAEGQELVAHPPNELADGKAIAPRG